MSIEEIFDDEVDAGEWHDHGADEGVGWGHRVF